MILARINYIIIDSWSTDSLSSSNMHLNFEELSLVVASMVMLAHVSQTGFAATTKQENTSESIQSD